MKRQIFLKVAVLNILFIALFFLCCSYAGDATTYKITVQEVKLLKSDGVTWVTIASPNQEIDIASASAGATAGSFFSDIPAGDYINFELVVSETMKFSGTDGGHNTRQGGTITITGNDASDASTATWAADPPNATLTEGNETCDGTAGEVTVTLDLDAGDADSYIEVRRGTNLTTPISVKSDSEISMYFDFDTQNTVHFEAAGGANIMYYTPPGAGTKFEITVDGVTTTITEADMEIYF